MGRKDPSKPGAVRRSTGSCQGNCASSPQLKERFCRSPDIGSELLMAGSFTRRSVKCPGWEFVGRPRRGFRVSRDEGVTSPVSDYSNVDTNMLVIAPGTDLNAEITAR